MAKEFFKDLPNTTTPLNATRLNGLLDGEESMGNLVVDSIRSKNLADTDNYLLGHINTSTGTIEPNSDWAYSKVNVEVSTQYTYQITSTSSQQYEIAFYDSSNTFQHCDDGNFGTGTNSVTVTTYSDTAYVLIAWRNDLSHSNIQLEKGSTATNYSPYQELNNQEVYSTNEIRVGTWIDGKPLYRKVVLGTLVDGDLAVNLTSSNIYEVIKVDGFCRNQRPLNFYFSGYSVSTRFSDGYMYIFASTPYANDNFKMIIEYTKTTD